jgi:hypothetical protein
VLFGMPLGEAYLGRLSLPIGTPASGLSQKLVQYSNLRGEIRILPYGRSGSAHGLECRRSDVVPTPQSEPTTPTPQWHRQCRNARNVLDDGLEGDMLDALP